VENEYLKNGLDGEEACLRHRKARRQERRSSFISEMERAGRQFKEGFVKNIKRKEAWAEEVSE